MAPEAEQHKSGVTTDGCHSEIIIKNLVPYAYQLHSRQQDDQTNLKGQSESGNF